MGKMKIPKTKEHIAKEKSVKQYFARREEKNKRTGSHTSRIAPDWWEDEVKGKKPLRVCSRCGAVYFDEHWHTIPGFSKIYKKMLPKKPLHEELCFECRWIKEGKWESKTHWEGELILENLIPRDKGEILNLVRNVGRRATKRDPEDQIIKIEDMGSKVRITTTENQLAVSIGKQVSWAFKGGDLKINWSHEDAPARVKWVRK